MTSDAATTARNGWFTIEKSFQLDGVSHELTELPEGHKCRRNHGHNYVVTVTVTADELDEFGFVTDFGELRPFGDYLRDTFDHRLLNDVVDFHPTAELLAQHLGGWFVDHVEPGIHGRLLAVRVAETSAASATWTQGRPVMTAGAPPVAGGLNGGPSGAGSLLVAEQFVSVQGEGPLAGQRCAFVRLSRCNLRCGWCDTPETWDWARFDPREVAYRAGVDEVAGWVIATGVDLLVLTGGEPLLQQDGLCGLLDRVPETVRVQVETNGTRSPLPGLAERVDLWVVSPKLLNSGVPEHDRIVPDALAALRRTGRAAFKFVVGDPDTDVAEVEDLVERHQLTGIWLMPQGTTVAEVVAGTAAVLGPAGERAWNVTTRLHILAGAR